MVSKQKILHSFEKTLKANTRPSTTHTIYQRVDCIAETKKTLNAPYLSDFINDIKEKDRIYVEKEILGKRQPNNNYLTFKKVRREDIGTIYRPQNYNWSLHSSYINNVTTLAKWPEKLREAEEARSKEINYMLDKIKAETKKEVQNILSKKDKKH